MSETEMTAEDWKRDALRLRVREQVLAQAKQEKRRERMQDKQKQADEAMTSHGFSLVRVAAVTSLPLLQSRPTRYVRLGMRDDAVILSSQGARNVAVRLPRAAEEIERKSGEVLPPVPSRVPSVGSVVHYVAYGTPGGEFPAGVHRAAIITELYPTPTRENPDKQSTNVGLCILNPTGMFFNQHIPFDLTGRTPGTWHWPEVEA